MIVGCIGWIFYIIYRSRFYFGLGIYYNYWLCFYICILLLKMIIIKFLLTLIFKFKIFFNSSERLRFDDFILYIMGIV